MNLDAVLKKFDYPFPKEAVANEPASPRDAAKLLVCKRGVRGSNKKAEIKIDTFFNLDSYIPSNAVLVLNETKVMPARLRVRKDTGGLAIIFFVAIEKNLWRVMSDRPLRIGSTLHLNNLSFKIIRQEEKFYILRPSFPLNKTQDVLLRYGETPIPYYIKNTQLSEKELREKYQTIFAKKYGSVAAPTASLHFTNRLFKKLKAKGITIVYLTLHVNLGTFGPVVQEHLDTGTLHSEYYEIPKKTAKILNDAKRSGRPIIAVGTTVVRTLESASEANAKATHRSTTHAARSNTPAKFSRLVRLSGETKLFIQEDYTPKFVDQLITNFHVPRSSLLMLVSAFIPRKKLFDLYALALKNNFRFFSFGDGMYIC